MNVLNLEGIVPPLITPFTNTGEVYEEGLRRLLDFQVAKGTHALFMCGTYGSGPLMSTEDRKQVATITVDQINGKIPIIVQVGTPSSGQTLELARHAQDIGADAVASVPPFYYTYDEAAVAQYFQSLVDAVDLPVFIYNNPQTSGFNLTPEFLVRLVELGVKGIKDSCFSFVQFTHYLNALGTCPEFCYMMGTETLFLPALMLGVKSCIVALGNTYPELVIDLFNAFRDKNYNQAATLQLKATQVREKLYIAPTPYSACYSILRWRGIDVGVPKPPMLPASREQEEHLKAAFQNLGLPVTPE